MSSSNFDHSALPAQFGQAVEAIRAAVPAGLASPKWGIIWYVLPPPLALQLIASSALPCLLTWSFLPSRSNVRYGVAARACQVLHPHWSRLYMCHTTPSPDLQTARWQGTNRPLPLATSRSPQSRFRLLPAWAASTRTRATVRPLAYSPPAS